MISKCQIKKYICQIELEISDGICSTDTESSAQYYGMLYGMKIANGTKKYPIKSGAIEITDEFKRGLLMGLRKVLFCDKKQKETPKERYEDGKMKTKEEAMNIIKNITDAINFGIYDHDERQFERGRIRGMLSVFDDDGVGVHNETNLKVNVKYELDKAAYKKFIADMKEIEAECIGCKTQEVCIPIQTVGDKDGHFIKVKYNDMPEKQD